MLVHIDYIILSINLIASYPILGANGVLQNLFGKLIR